jgi:hypothetical protein
MTPGLVSRAIAGASILLLHPGFASAQGTTPATTDAQAYADGIAREIEVIRGLRFKQPVKVETQTSADYGKHVSAELEEAVPEVQRRHYDKIVRTLGLYRGPVIEDFSSMMTAVVSSQTGAYYDPEKKSFFVLLQGMPEMMQGVLYSHELYHAMQDQYFDLTGFIEGAGKVGEASFNSDRHMARGAVVEGEATYVMSLWMAQKMSGRPAPRELMQTIVAMQANLTMDQLREMVKQPAVADVMGKDMRTAMDASEDIPAFIMDSMMGVYLKGLSFVFAIHEHGWPMVEKLYGDYPPESTEQILHPEKWLAREAPVEFRWPKFRKVKALRGWELLDDDVLGEFQWRIVFKEQGFAAQADAAAAGWAGDRYAVFKRQDSDATLLLLRTSWDSEADAMEFADLYGRVQAAKYAGAPRPVRLERTGVDVFVVEGGDARGADALLKLVRGTRPVRPARPGVSP